jgi:hypothetical protein
MTPNQEQLAFFNELGGAIHQWQNLELAIYQVATACSDQNPGEIYDHFYCLPGFDSRLQFADSLISPKLKETQFWDEWRRLHSRIGTMPCNAIRSCITWSSSLPIRSQVGGMACGHREQKEAGHQTGSPSLVRSARRQRSVAPGTPLFSECCPANEFRFASSRTGPLFAESANTTKRSNSRPFGERNPRTCCRT